MPFSHATLMEQRRLSVAALLNAVEPSEILDDVPEQPKLMDQLDEQLLPRTSRRMGTIRNSSQLENLHLVTHPQPQEGNPQSRDAAEESDIADIADIATSTIRLPPLPTYKPSLPTLVPPGLPPINTIHQPELGIQMPSREILRLQSVHKLLTLPRSSSQRLATGDSSDGAMNEQNLENL